MTKPKKQVKKQKPKKTTEDLESLTNDEVMQRIFGPEGQQELKDQALANERPEHNDYRIP